MKSSTTLRSGREKVCEIPAATILRITRDMAQLKPKAAHPSRLSRGLRVPVSEQLSDREGPGHRQRPSGEHQPGRGNLLSPKRRTSESCSPNTRLPKGPRSPSPTGPGSREDTPWGVTATGSPMPYPELALRGELKAGFVYHNNPLAHQPQPQTGDRRV